ncbi:hypothetical protein GGX14DRAFT_463181, partial [Mycena pura]
MPYLPAAPPSLPTFPPSTLTALGVCVSMVVGCSVAYYAGTYISRKLAERRLRHVDLECSSCVIACLEGYPCTHCCSDYPPQGSEQEPREGTYHGDAQGSDGHNERKFGWWPQEARRGADAPSSRVPPQ